METGRPAWDMMRMERRLALQWLCLLCTFGCFQIVRLSVQAPEPKQDRPKTMGLAQDPTLHSGLGQDFSTAQGSWPAQTPTTH